MRNLEKISRLQILVEHKPDVITGYESHLDASYLTAEIFSHGYAIIRLLWWRWCFLAKLNDIPLLMYQLLQMQKWSGLKFYQFMENFSSLPLFIDHQMVHNIIPMEELKPALLSKGLTNNNIVIAGDFNFPSVVWEDGNGCIESNPIHGINEFGLEQQVNEYTSNVTVIPGMSDHEAVSFIILTSLDNTNSNQ